MTFIITLFGSPNQRRPVRRIALLAGAGGLLFGAAGATAETLMDAVTAAYGSNPDLVAQRFRQKAQNETYVQTRAQYGPQLSLSATAQYNYTKYGDALSRIRGRSTDANQGDLSLNLRQPMISCPARSASRRLPGWSSYRARDRRRPFPPGPASRGSDNDRNCPGEAS